MTALQPNRSAVDAVLRLDLALERRREDEELAERETRSDKLVAGTRTHMREVRSCVEVLASEGAHALAVGGEAVRALELRLGEADVRQAQLRRRERELRAQLEEMQGAGGVEEDVGLSDDDDEYGS